MIEIENKKVPHSFRNKYLRNSGSVSLSTTTPTPPASGGGVDIDVLKVDDGRVAADSNVFSSLRALLEIKSRIIALSNDTTIPNDENTLSSLRTRAEINAAIESLEKLLKTKYLSKTESDETQFLIKLLGGLIIENGLTATGGVSADTLTSQLLNVLDRLSAKDAVISNKATTLNLLVQSLAEARNLSVSNVATLMGTIVKDYVSSESFTSGFSGEGMKIYKAINGDWNMEIDNLTVRKIFSIFELMVQKITHQGGMVIRSAAGAKLTKVTDGGSYWRCEHDSTDDFAKDDQIICQAYTGTVKRYWRLITSTGAGFFNLSKTDCEANSAIPAVGDEVAVLGNRTNAARQKAQVDCTVGNSAPYSDNYDGINSYSLAGKIITRTGNLTGITDAAFGVLSGSGLYAKNVYLKGMFILQSGKTVESEIQGAVDEIKVGGTNLATGTGTFESNICQNYMRGWVVSPDTFRGNKVMECDARDWRGWYISNLEPISGKSVIVSFYAKTDAGSCRISPIVNGWSGVSSSTGWKVDAEWKQHVMLFQDGCAFRNSGNQGIFEFYNYSDEVTKVYVSSIKVELGNKATDWTPAPEDIENRITTVETNFEIREGQISSKVSEATIAATNAKRSETNANTKAGEASTSAGNAKKSADDAAAKLVTITEKESSINQTAGGITLQVSEVQKKATEAANSAANAGTNATNAANSAELAAAMSRGKMLYRDASFAKGVNGIRVYNNWGGEKVTITRESNVAGNPNSSGYCLKITTTGQVAPNWGGWTFWTPTKANQILVARFIAKIPVGYNIDWATNAAGDDGTFKWLTGTAGTGQWTEYACKLVCGSTGTFSTTMYFYLYGGVTPTPAVPLIWYLSYATVFDVTDAEVDYIADAAAKYSTKTELSTSIKQLSDSISLKAEKSELTALSSRVSSAEAKITPEAINLTVKSQTQTLVADASKRTEVVVDATGLDENTYYPVTMLFSVGVPMYIITMSRTLNRDFGVPSYCTHSSGFSVTCKWSANASGWGTIPVQRTILEYAFGHALTAPVGSIGQMDHSSHEYAYVRGGSKYKVIVEGQTDVSIVLHTSSYTSVDQTIDVKTEIVRPVVDLKERPTTEAIKSQINLDGFGVSVFGKKIDFTGKVTFNSMDSAMQGTINGKATTGYVDAAKTDVISKAATDAQTKANAALTSARGYTDALKNSLGAMAYESLVTKAKLDSTIIEGGYIKTSLIDADTLITSKLLADKIAAVDITTGKLTVTTGAKIGGFKVDGNELISKDASGSISIGNEGGRFLRINEYGRSDASKREALLQIRNDSGGCANFSGGGSRPALSINTSGTAIASYGSHIFCQRAGEAWNAPGVLWVGRINSGGWIEHSWGNGAGGVSAQRNSTGEYQINHNLGHTEYCVMITCTPYATDNSGYLFGMIREKYNRYFTLRTIDSNRGNKDMVFEVAILGRNIFQNSN